MSAERQSGGKETDLGQFSGVTGRHSRLRVRSANTTRQPPSGRPRMTLVRSAARESSRPGCSARHRRGPRRGAGRRRLVGRRSRVARHLRHLQRLGRRRLLDDHRVQPRDRCRRAGRARPRAAGARPRVRRHRPGRVLGGVVGVRTGHLVPRVDRGSNGARSRRRARARGGSARARGHPPQRRARDQDLGRRGDHRRRVRARARRLPHPTLQLAGDLLAASAPGRDRAHRGLRSARAGGGDPPAAEGAGIERGRTSGSCCSTARWSERCSSRCCCWSWSGVGSRSPARWS